VGYTCLPGVIPHTFIYEPPDGPPPVIDGPPGDCTGVRSFRLNGCSSAIIREVPCTATAAEIQVVVNEMFAEWENRIYGRTSSCYTRLHLEAEAGDSSNLLSAHSIRPPLVSTVSVSIFASEAAVFSIIELSRSAEPATPTTTAVISGTPTTAGTTVFVIQATVGPFSAFKQVTFAVVGITTGSPLTDGSEGVAYSQTLAATGMSGTLTWAVTGGSLPPGLSLNTATGEISGNPTTAGAYAFTVSVTN
jgi:hypothetical protein